MYTPDDVSHLKNKFGFNEMRSRILWFSTKICFLLIISTVFAPVSIHAGVSGLHEYLEIEPELFRATQKSARPVESSESFFGKLFGKLKNDVVWPAPPDIPRIRYVREYKDSSIKKPMGIWASDGFVYLTDTSASEVFSIDKRQNTIKKLPRNNSFFKPLDVVTDLNGRIFVTDVQSDKVSILDSNGNFQAFLEPISPFQQPTSLGVDNTRNRLYVADTHKHQLYVFDLATLRQIGTIGTKGSGMGEFNFPSYISVDNDGKIFVSDTMNGRVQIFSPEGNFIKSFGTFGDKPGQFARIKGIAVDSEGHIYVVDAAFNNIQIFNESGQVLLAFTSYGSNAGQVILPADIAIDNDDYIYVVDSYNKRVLVFEYLGDKYKARNLSH